MEKYMLGAAAVLALTTGVHLFVGTPEIIPPILSAVSIDSVVRGVALVVWHMVSLILMVSTGAMIYLAHVPNAALLICVATLQFGFALIFIWVNVSMFSALFAMPQWTAYLIAALLMSVSYFKSTRS